MDFDFETVPELRGTHSSKYDNIAKNFGSDDPDVIAMWVADMDFVAAPAIRRALQKEIDRGWFGYFADPGPASRALAHWYRDRHGWAMDPGWARYTHGVISGLADAIALASQPGDAIVVFAPVYHAFYRQIEAMGRRVLESPLRIEDGRYMLDLDGLADDLDPGARAVVLSSPHNPGGRIWSAGEQAEVARFCAEHDLLLISDEVHMDLCFPGETHVPMAVAAPGRSDRLVVLTAASKGFNLAGGETGVAIVPDDALRRRFDKIVLDRESSPNRFAMAMLEAAFTEGGPWIDAARAYIAENFRIFADRLNALPGISVMEMRATYLAWADFSATGLSDREIARRMIDRARIAASPGAQFGQGGAGHMRFNLALPRPRMLEAISRIEAAFSKVGAER